MVCFASWFVQTRTDTYINGRLVYGADEIAQIEAILQSINSSGFSVIICFADECAETYAFSKPFLMIHSSRNLGAKLSKAQDVAHAYDATASANFVLPSHSHYEPGAANVSHTRSLGFIKKHLGGPIFDLEAIWDEHTLYEFGERDVAKTMNTMVEEPYVNHVPTVYPLFSALISC